MTGAPVSRSTPRHRRLLAVEMDVGAEPRQLLHVHEAVLEDRLADFRRALGARHQRHELRLQVGREAGERLGRDVDRTQARRRSGVTRMPGIRLAHLRAGRGDRVERALQQARLGALQQRHRRRPPRPPWRRCRSRSGRAARGASRRQSRSTPGDVDRVGAGAFDPRAHLDQAFGEIAHLRLARGVLDHRLALRQRRRHHDRVGRADGDMREADAPADQPARRLGDDIAGLDVELRRRAPPGPSGRSRPAACRWRSRRAATRAPRACARAAARSPRSSRACARRARRARSYRRCSRRESVSVSPAFGLSLGALAAHHVVDAVIGEDALQQRHVGEVGDVLQRQPLVGQKARDHQRQGGVLGAGDRDRADETAAADNANAIHQPESPVGLGASGRAPPFVGSAERSRCCALRRFRLIRKASASRRWRSLRASPPCLERSLIAALSSRALRRFKGILQCDFSAMRGRGAQPPSGGARRNFRKKTVNFLGKRESFAVEQAAGGVLAGFRQSA